MIANTNGLVTLEGRLFKGSEAAERLNGFSLVCAPGLPEFLRIRPCEESDRAAVCRLCCDTGFLGRPVDSVFSDRELFAELFTRPYLDHEPDWGIIAEVKGQVVGYLLGSVSPRFDFIQLRSGFLTASKMILRLAAGRYAGHPRSRKFIRWLFTAGLREQPKHPPGAAHLHLNVEHAYRGRGVGRRLWEYYEQRLLAAGVKRCYGAFFSHPKRRPELAYVRYGFTVFDRRRTTIFAPDIADPVEVVCVSKSLVPHGH